MSNQIRWTLGQVLHQVHSVLDNRWGYIESDLTFLESIMWAAAQGFEGLVLCAHGSKPGNPRPVSAGGRTIQLLRAAQDQVRSLRVSSPLQMVFGPEASILHDGSLDLPTNRLAEFEYLIAGRHSLPKRAEKDPRLVLESLIVAMRNPYVRTIAHIDRFIREVDVNWAEVFRVAAGTGTAVEFSYSLCPSRTDPEMEDARRIMWAAANSEATVLIGADMHRRNMFFPNSVGDERSYGIGRHCLPKLETFYDLLQETGLTTNRVLTNDPTAFFHWVRHGKTDRGRSV